MMEQRISGVTPTSLGRLNHSPVPLALPIFKKAHDLMVAFFICLIGFIQLDLRTGLWLILLSNHALDLLFHLASFQINFDKRLLLF